MNLAPRAVPSSSWRHWLVAGIALATRRMGAFLALSAAAMLLHGIASEAGFGVVAVPLVFGLGCVFAACSDQGHPIPGALRATPARAYGRLLLIGVVFGVLAWSIGALVVLLARPLGIDPLGIPLPASETARSVVGAWCSAWLISASVCLFGASVLLGFLIPLVASGHRPLRAAMILTLSGIRLNPFVVVATAALAATAAVGLITPFLAVPWTAIVSAVLYVAYRDVFLGQRDNAPVSQRAAATSAAMSS